ncbi:unnamed protein product [Durusdinium trenchii]|uniref:Uncharacterized protein n=1 Tax=Durusdinium trenchii TaxID=1381693 RepID=A0ABP0NEI6_9DINO
MKDRLGNEKLDQYRRKMEKTGATGRKYCPLEACTEAGFNNSVWQLQFHQQTVFEVTSTWVILGACNLWQVKSPIKIVWFRSRSPVMNCITHRSSTCTTFHHITT